MTPTLDHLRRALERALSHTTNPAMLRLPEGERTMEGVAGAYLPRWLCFDEPRYRPALRTIDMIAEDEVRVGGRVPLDLTDPGTAHALLVALALALGLDPGVGGVGVAWFFVPETDATPWRRWCLMADRLMDFADLVNRAQGSRYAPTVAAEPDPLKALALAVLHVLEVSRG